ncbi:MAG: peptidylprolyl isomerase [Chthoniobacterales bacterium]
MSRGFRNLLLLLLAGAAGWGASEALYRASWSRDVLGRAMGRGEFLGLARGRAIYARDLFQAGGTQAETILVADTLRESSRGAQASAHEVEREAGLFHAQFGEEATFAGALESAGLTESSLREMVSDHLIVRHWIEEQIAPALTATDDECREIYESEPARFELPPRFRASHLFVAAPEGTALEVVLEKRSFAQGLSVRLLAGEGLADLAQEASEDEETKTRGGDLGYFSAWRMPPDFLTELAKLSVGQTSPPVQCRLGFHIVALTERRPARRLTIEEARGEIASQIVNQKRAAAVADLTSEIRRPDRERGTLTRP